MRLLCETLDMHRCNLYHEPRPDEDQPMKDALRELGGAWPTYGYRRLTAMLRREGLRVNAKRVRRLMHELGMCGEAPNAGLGRPTAATRIPGSPTWSRAWRRSVPSRSGWRTSPTFD